MKKLSLLSAFGLVALLSSQAFAIVDMKNANFANSWVDLEVPGSGYDLKINRTYNSKSLFDGMFGFGWCSDFETTLQVTAEGNIKLTECGAGQEIYFTPREFGKKEIDKTVAQILEKVKAAKKPDEKTLKKLAEDLATDHDLRSKFAFAYKVALPIKEGTQFFANGREVENIIFGKGLYTRNLPDGSFMRFDKDGKMTHMYDKNNNYLKLEYDGNTLREISDNNGRKLSFKMYSNKKVKTIVGPNNLTAEYKFNNLNDLSGVKTAFNTNFVYEYDDVHNLTKATYPDNTFIALTYDKKNDWVTSFIDREKCKEDYKYEFDEKDPKMHYWSSVKKVCGKEVVNNSKHEFWYAERKDGQVFLSRVASTVNDNITDITYHEVYGKPVAIRRNNERFTYDYYSNGQVKVKNSDAAKLSFEYDQKSGKVSQVTSVYMNEKGKTTLTRRVDFKYDPKGNLVFAQNTDGQKVTMTYDQRGRIATITDQAKKIVKIEYEERFGKPAIVTRPGLGTIKVSYKPSGEIDKVNSAEGPTVAMQVASTFNNLLDVIAPATAEVFN
jgi:YD repeat-containing protein